MKGKLRDFRMMQAERLAILLESHIHWFGEISGKVIAVGGDSVLTKETGFSGKLYISYYNDGQICHDVLKKGNK